MSKISVRAICSIKEGKLDEFKGAAATCRAIVKEKDTGTLRYDWYLSDDQSVCVVLESYENSDAVLAHMGNLGDALGALLALSDLKLEIYGTPSAQLAEAVAGLDAVQYGPL